MASEEYSRFAICREMGWDYHTYLAQPPFFIEEIAIFLTQEAKKNKSSEPPQSKPATPKGYSRM